MTKTLLSAVLLLSVTCGVRAEDVGATGGKISVNFVKYRADTLSFTLKSSYLRGEKSDLAIFDGHTATVEIDATLHGIIKVDTLTFNSKGTATSSKGKLVWKLNPATGTITYSGKTLDLSTLIDSVPIEEKTGRLGGIMLIALTIKISNGSAESRITSTIFYHYKSNYKTATGPYYKF